MSRRIVDTGRVEMKGAEVRFKQKGTLEAFDRNIADLERVFVRSTPSPDIHLFADFVFPHEVFRVWQDSTLVNYKDFLEKVDLAGIENFRSMVGYVTQAAAPEALDATSRDFAGKRGPPERFVNRDELGDYDRALARGENSPTSRKPAPSREQAAGHQKAQAVEEAWKELAPQLAAVESQARVRSGPIAGAVLIGLGIVTALFVGRAFLHFRAQQFERTSPAIVGVFAAGGVLALAFLVMGAVYLRRDTTKQQEVS